MPDKTPWGPEHPDYDKGCPVAAGNECTLWFRGDLPKVTTAAHLYNWRHFDHSRDITDYEPHSAPDQARELLAECRDLFRTYERNHTSKAREITTMGHSAERDSRLEKAGRNGDMADRIDAYLKGAS